MNSLVAAGFLTIIMLMLKYTVFSGLPWWLVWSPIYISSAILLGTVWICVWAAGKVIDAAARS